MFGWRGLCEHFAQPSRHHCHRAATTATAASSAARRRRPSTAVRATSVALTVLLVAVAPARARRVAFCRAFFARLLLRLAVLAAGGGGSPAPAPSVILGNMLPDFTTYNAGSRLYSQTSPLPSLCQRHGTRLWLARTAASRPTTLSITPLHMAPLALTISSRLDEGRGPSHELRPATNPHQPDADVASRPRSLPFFASSFCRSHTRRGSRGCPRGRAELRPVVASSRLEFCTQRFSDLN